MPQPRDSQRQRVYDAEELMQSGRRIPVVGDIQTYVDKIVSSRWFRSRFGFVSVRVKDGRGRRRAGGHGFRVTDSHIDGYITMPKWSRYELCILHELTHVVTPSDLPWHGRTFAKTLLALVSRWMGKDAAKDLRRAFRKYKVKWHSKRNISPERRRELSYQMQRIRASNNHS